MITISLSFDDGRRDNYIAFKEIMEPMGIPATYNITSGYIQRNIEESDCPGPHEPMTIDELKEMNTSSIVEIAGHGYSHDNSMRSLLEGIQWLRNTLSIDSIGIASPHSEYEISRLNSDIQCFKDNNVKYLRISNDFSRFGISKKIARKCNKICHSGALFYYFNRDSIMKEHDFLLHSVPILRITTVNELKNFIKIVTRKFDQGSIIFMLHSILKPVESYYDDLFSWDYDQFREFCEFLIDQQNKGNIQLKKTIDL